MAVWKQLLISAVVLAAIVAAWFFYFPGAQGVLERYGLIAAVAPADGGAAGPSSARAGGGGGRPGGFGGGGRGGFFGGGRSTIVVVQPVSSAVINTKVSALGTGAALHSVTVLPNASGTIVSIAATSGANVKAGEVIAKLDADDQTIAFNKAQLAYADAETTYKRYSGASGTFTQVQVQAAQLAAQTAKLNLESAALALQNRTITAPIEGTLGLLQVGVGNAVTSQTVVATIEDHSAIVVDFWLPERFAGQVKAGDAVSAVPVARPQQQVSGTIIAVDNKIDPASGTFQVRAEVPNGDNDLQPGMAFSVSMDFPGDRFLAVDPLSIQWGSEGSYVWLDADGKAKKVMVRIVQRNTDSVLVAGELKEADQVITEGLNGLRDGAEVQIAGQPVAETSSDGGQGSGGGQAGGQNRGAGGQGGNGQRPGAGNGQPGNGAGRPAANSGG